MNTHFLYPLHRSAEFLLQHCKLPPHTGTVTAAGRKNPDDSFVRLAKQVRQAPPEPETAPAGDRLAATFLCPASGDCLLFLQGEAAGRLSCNFGEGLALCGLSADGPFELICPEYYIKAVSARQEQPSWAIGEPINQPVTISYGVPRTVAKVCAVINNFDVEHGNVSAVRGESREGKVLRVDAAGRPVDFTWREGHRELKCLADAEVLRSTALTTFSFSAWDGASEADLTQFAYDVASLCAIVARQHTGIPVMSFMDGDGRPIRRIIRNPVESAIRRNYTVRFLHHNRGLPQLFRECFDEHVRMQRSDLWRRLPFLCAAIEDSPYLEQKFATLMAAVELLIRSSLVENKHCSAAESEDLTLPKLLGAARGKLGWAVPKHYTAKERHRHLRNAVAHGGKLPGDVKEVRHDFDKWHLFLLRRLLVRLGFTGEVASPEAGCASSSAVGDFSEEHNAFGP